MSPDDPGPEYSDARHQQPRSASPGDVRPPSRAFSYRDGTRRLCFADEAIERAGWDLDDPEDLREYVEMLTRAKNRMATRRRLRESWAVWVARMVAAVGGAFLTIYLPDVIKWLKAHFL